MKLYVLRHGVALTVTEAKVGSDAERPLADLGREDVRTQAKELQAKGAAVAVILCSPLKRARQTADEAAAILKPKSGVEVFDPLANLISGVELYAAIREQAPKVSELMVIGHQPQLGEMVAHLVGNAVDLRPGGLIALDLGGNGKAKLLWSKNP